MADTLREYLVKLGFSVDENTYRKYQEFVARAASTTAALGAEAIAAATAIGIETVAVSRHYEQLSYVAQRTGASITNLRAYEFAVRQIGLTAEQGTAMVEGFGSAMRLNPGLRGFAQSMGIDAQNAQRGVMQLVGQLKARFGEKGYFVAAPIAQMFGLDEQTFRQVWDNYRRLSEAQTRYEEKLKAAGLTSKDVQSNMIELSRRASDMQSSFSVAADVIAKDFLPVVSRMVPMIDEAMKRFVAMDKDSGGNLGVAAGLAATSLPLLLFKRFRGLVGPAALSMIPALMAGSKQDALNGNQFRSYVRRQLYEMTGSDMFLETDEDRNTVPSYARHAMRRHRILQWRRRNRGLGAKQFGAGETDFDISEREARALDGGAYFGGPLGAGGRRAPEVTVNQKTEINLLPGQTAWETAQGVAFTQDRVNAEMVRFFGKVW